MKKPFDAVFKTMLLNSTAILAAQALIARSDHYAKLDVAIARNEIIKEQQK